MKTSFFKLKLRHIAVYAVTLAVILSTVSVGFGVLADDPVYHRLHSGNTVGEVWDSGKQTVVAGVENILGGQTVNRVTVTNSGWAQHVSNSQSLTAAGISAESVKTLSVFVKSDESSTIFFRAMNRSEGGDYAYQEFKVTNAPVWLFDINKNTVLETSTDGGGCISLAPGFYGYIIYDFAGSDPNQVTDMLTKNDGLSPLMISLDVREYINEITYYYGDIRVWECGTQQAKDALSDEYYSSNISAPVADPDSGYVNKGDTVTLTAEDGADIYYTINTETSDREPAVVFDGSNGVSWYDGNNFDLSYEDGALDEGPAAVFTPKKASYSNISMNTSASAEPVSRVQAITVRLKVSDFGGEGVSLSPCINHEGSYWNGTIYAVDSDGTVTTFNSSLKLNDFDGILIFPIGASTEISVQYSATKLKWSEFMQQYGGLQNIQFLTSIPESENIGSAKLIFDSFTLNYDAAALMEEKAPDIDFSWYTPFVEVEYPDLDSEKYTEPITIDRDMTICAVAYSGGKKSIPVSFSYWLIDPDAPNLTPLNDGNDISQTDATAKVKVEIINDASPDGEAYSVMGNGMSGSGYVEFKTKLYHSSLVLNNEAFTFWASIPGNLNYTFSPRITTEANEFTGTMLTYSTSTGELKTYDLADGVTLSGFEGYVILKFDDNAKVNNSSREYTWEEFVKEVGFNSFILYNQNAETDNRLMVIDDFAFVTDLDEYLAELEKTELRPALPYAGIVGGEHVAGTNVPVYAGTGTEIYYTLDGTTPTTDSIRYVPIGMGGNVADTSPININEDMTLKAIAVKDGVSSRVITYTYAVEIPYTGPDTVILNDGSGEGSNTFNWVDTNTWNTTIETENLPDAPGFKMEYIADEIKATANFFNGSFSQLEKPYKLEALSFYAKIPDYGEAHRVQIGLYLNGEDTGIRTKIYAVSNEGKVQVFEKTQNLNLSNFEGVIIVTLEGEDAVSLEWGAKSMSWDDYMRENTFNNIGFYISFGAEIDAVKGSSLYFDSFKAHYDLQKLMTEYDIEGLLAKYDVATFENANMIVANDCSGNTTNGAFSAISEGLTVDKSDASADDRCIMLTFGKQDGVLNFINYCTSDDALAGDGFTFWVELPDSTPAVTLDLAAVDSANNGTEHYYYSDTANYYLIDRDGVISKKEGAVTVPSGFRGWIILPGSSFFLDGESSVFDNGLLDYNAVSDIELTVYNTDGKLENRNMYIDDICFYMSFDKLVKSRALRWDGQSISELPDNETGNVPVTGENTAPLYATAAAVFVSACALVLLGYGLKKKL